MSDALAISFRAVTKSFPRHNGAPPGLKAQLLHPIRTLRARSTGETFDALKDVTLDIARGESFGVTGANGSGKSTLLSLIAGVIRPTSGSVTVHGSVSPLLELGAGFHGDLTGRENVYLSGIIMGLRRSDVARRFDRIVEYSGVGDFLDEPIRNYSTGMRARLGFAVAAHSDPEILLVDEVLAVGDEEFQDRCILTLQQIHRDGGTLVLVSHNRSLIGRLCNRTGLLERGRLTVAAPAPAASAAEVHGVTA